MEVQRGFAEGGGFYRAGGGGLFAVSLVFSFLSLEMVGERCYVEDVLC